MGYVSELRIECMPLMSSTANSEKLSCGNTSASSLCGSLGVITPASVCDSWIHIFFFSLGSAEPYGDSVKNEETYLENFTELIFHLWVVLKLYQINCILYVTVRD